MKDKYYKYCTGCGLCEAMGITKLEKDKKGFYHPRELSIEYDNICPASGSHINSLESSELWGRKRNVYVGWSSNDKIREKASSGGILTEIAIYLLESHKVDYIIHTGTKCDNPTQTVTCFSKSRDEIINNCGSRYAISSPLREINKIDKSKRYAFIGKPCDVVALKNRMRYSKTLQKCILYTFSFFCMGLPSDEAQQKLLLRLGVSNCRTLIYRGNGWPGYTTATDYDNKEKKISYEESWGKILGRDLMPACKFCIDGIGEMADISCGDAWYINNNNMPDFSEHEGRNVIFARTMAGEKLLEEMGNDRRIILKKYDNYNIELPIIQTSQWCRRRELFPRILALKFMKQPYPSYEMSMLKKYSSDVNIINKVKIFLGTCKRIIKGSI